MSNVKITGTGIYITHRLSSLWSETPVKQVINWPYFGLMPLVLHQNVRKKDRRTNC